MSDTKPATLTLALLLVLIDRGKTVISKAVPEHEARVLKKLFPGKVTTAEELPEDMEPEGEFHPNAHMELARLHMAYRPDKVDGDSAVARAFPNGAEDLVAYGFTLGSEAEVNAVPRSMSVNEGLAERREKAAAKKAKAKKGGKAE